MWLGCDINPGVNRQEPMLLQSLKDLYRFHAYPKKRTHTDGHWQTIVRCLVVSVFRFHHPTSPHRSTGCSFLSPVYLLVRAVAMLAVVVACFVAHHPAPFITQPLILLRHIACSIKQRTTPLPPPPRTHPLLLIPRNQHPSFSAPPSTYIALAFCSASLFPPVFVVASTRG